VHRVPARPVVLATLACPAGCRGDADLQLGDYQDVRFHLHRRGRITLRFRLGAKTRRLLRRYRSVPYGLLLTWVQPSLGTDTPTLFRNGTLPGNGSRRYPPPTGPQPED